MKKNKDTIYYITVVADKYDNGDTLEVIRDKQGNQTNVKMTTGYYSKKKAKKAFKILISCSTYDGIMVSVMKSIKQNNNEYKDYDIGTIRLINEAMKKKKIKMRIKKLKW
ncbi:hypothetical protein JHD48_09670 [Sulfurimonas sp. SAG-AH-194-I05]|nr:hypothetical protein [Sulfurimonas sp. SAG-AH-194-I05]MDF1876003.1 hypothetical protein [Sulfurimonas sp. SAG-AH-194-I05]